MIFGSVSSGIEAASVAWGPLGWKPAFFSEIDKACCRLLAAKYPDVPNHGDMNNYKEWPQHAVDLLCGGTPCQSFSVAGLRKGMADPRGNLMLTYLAIAQKYRPRWLVWENVPGVLSSNGGRDFGTFLGGLAELGYGFAYRILDAQYIRVESHPRAVPQRRRRVILVGYLGDWRRAAAVLFERESLCGHPAPRRQARQGIARGIEIGPAGDNLSNINPTLASVSMCLNAGAMGRQDAESETLIPAMAYCTRSGMAPHGSMRGDMVSPALRAKEAEPPLVTWPINMQVAMRHNAMGEHTGLGVGSETDPAFTLQAAHSHAVAIQGAATRENPASGSDGIGVRDDGAASTLEARAIAYRTTGNSGCYETGAVTGALNTATDPNQNVITLAIRGRGDTHHLEYRQDGTANTVLTPSGGRSGIGVGAVAAGMAVRRLTPLECERLQGFPDGYTDVPPPGKATTPDGPRYKQLGNSWPINVVRWIGERIECVDAIPQGAVA